MTLGRLPVLEARVRDGLASDDPQFWLRCREAASALRDRFQEGRCNLANRAWFLKAVAETRSSMIAAIRQIQDTQQKDGWCTLEQVELGCRALRRNAFLRLDDYEVLELLEQVERWQSLFPYRVFASPEFVIETARCSICKTLSSPWSGCDHAPGRVYCGESCHRIIEGMHLKSVSLVLEPVQKFSVMIMHRDDGSDPMDYSLVDWVAKRVRSPFDRWNIAWTIETHPHHLFSARPDDPCPCESGKFYGSCCLYTRGVKRPHAQFDFPNPPPSDLPDFEYAGYDVSSQPLG